MSDEKEAPPFRGLLESQRSGARPARRVVPRLVVAAAAIFVVALSLALFSRRPRPDIDIGEWKAPTDFLLEASYPDLFDTTPPLLEAVPDYAPLLKTEKGSTS